MTLLQMKDLDGNIIEEKNIELKPGSLFICQFTNANTQRAFFKDRNLMDDLMNNLKKMSKNETGVLVLPMDFDVKIINKVEE